MNSLLPIGSIIKTKKDTRIQFMIIGYYPIDGESERQYDYSAVLYPYGIDGDDSFVVFNGEDVVEVVYKGYTNQEGEKLINNLPVIMQAMNEQ